MKTIYCPVKCIKSGADLGGGCRGCAPPPPRDDLQFSNTTGILPKKITMWFIGVEVEQETSAPLLKKNPGSDPENHNLKSKALGREIKRSSLDPAFSSGASYFAEANAKRD